MKKNYFITILILCFSLSSFGQGAEAFTNSGATSSYLDASFVGADDITWSYIHSRNANNDANGSGMTLPALMLRRVSSDSKITSSTVSNGIGDFSVKLYKGFTGGGDRQVELFINGESKGVSTAFDDFEEHIFTVSGINVSGDIIIEIKNSTAKQVIIDDITWTSYSNTSSPAIAITAPTDGATIDATTSVDVAISVTDFTVGATDAGLDGHIHWTVQENADAAVSQAMKYNTDAETISVTPGNSYTVYMELVDNSHTAILPAVNTTSTFSVAAVTAPTTDAPTPPARQAGDVVSVYSDAYANIDVTNFNPAWGQTGAVNEAYDPTGAGSNTVLEYSNFNYQGTVFATTDASAMEFVHIDIWTADATDVKFSPINSGTGVGEILVSVPVVTGEWSSVDIAIADFTGMTWDSLIQMKFDGAAGVNPSTIYIDNVYFWKAPTTAPNTDAPTPPAREAGDVVSVYSDAYTNIDVTNFNPAWGQTGAVDEAYDPTGAGSNTVLEYSNFNYQGTEFAATDASAMEFVHIDIWTVDATVVKFSPINNGTGTGEILINVPLVTGGWSSVDIAIADFTGMTWDSLFQMKFDGAAGVNPSTIYIDNVYFYREAVTAPTTDAPTPPAREAGDVISIYSDAYTNINVTNFNPAWGQTGAVDEAYDPTGAGSNTVLEYSNFNYQGTEFDATDASAMEFVHIDIWTADATDVKFSPVNNGTGVGEILVSVPVVTGAWSSVDIAIADFTGMTWDSLFQMKFDGAAGVNPSKIYLDNIYFYKASTAGVEDESLVTLNMYPNPANDVLNISAQNTINTVEIFNVLGQKVMNMRVENTSAEINVSNLNAGIYLIKYEINNSTSTKKFVKN
ncbi:T9SS type A sorting domain-containing protein [Polaribacter sp.]|nr:T9SS type A sorting domain-containing protein [Polaribacter sp.]